MRLLTPLFPGTDTAVRLGALMIVAGVGDSGFATSPATRRWPEPGALWLHQGGAIQVPVLPSGQ
jgi:hypothetical protein